MCRTAWHVNVVAVTVNLFCETNIHDFETQAKSKYRDGNVEGVYLRMDEGANDHGDGGKTVGVGMGASSARARGGKPGGRQAAAIGMYG